MVYDDYREDKEFSKQISSSLHSLLLVQRADCNISGMTVNSSLHSRRQSMIGLRHIQQYNISHVRTQHQTRARKNESGSWPGQCWWWNFGTWGGNRPPSWACWRLVCTRFSERVLLASPPETPPSLTCTSGLEEKLSYEVNSDKANVVPFLSSWSWVRVIDEGIWISSASFFLNKKMIRVAEK